MQHIKLTLAIILTIALATAVYLCGTRFFRAISAEPSRADEAALFGPLTLLSLFLCLLSLALPILLSRSTGDSDAKASSERNNGTDPHEYTP